MLSRTKQERKLKLIGWLMLASQILLLMFLTWWITGQYREEKKRLSQDVQIIFNTVEDRISDSLLNTQLAILFKNKLFSDTTIVLNLSEDKNLLAASTLTEEINHIITNAVAVPKAIQMKGNVSIQLPSTAPDTATIKILPEDKSKLLRFALRQIMNDSIIATLQAKIDTNFLKKEFNSAVQQKLPLVSVEWHTNQNESNAFTYKPRDVAKNLNLNGYRWYLIKAVLPQAAFCTILLLLTSLTFMLAYRNTKQQTLFSLQKDQFISNVSHELKTPVATTKVAIEALSKYDGLIDPQRSRRYLRMAGWEINRLETMIHKIMDTTQAANGVLVMEKKPLYLPELLQEITYSLQQVLIEQEKQLHWDMQDQPLIVLADHTHLTGAIYNLIDNAIKYGGKVIRISLHQKDNTVILRIADNGSGIPQAYQSKIFEKFVRIPEGNTHNVKGYGLGLSYAQYIVEAHGGRLQLEQEVGWGAIFRISLPELYDHAI